ncbi:DUF898 domain-containing protein [Sphingomonas gilva]|uniref:DUF898 domain-containing protein n=1 Tax=Sphingomonas gilva TaxID=2305907 RepID=A0A396RU68_9SPHN|nr:YjgN family protein [Sphingomonas gilva]RHW18992.1 DUF898 domain-containing protein [Sphingomonas gilva]
MDDDSQADSAFAFTGDWREFAPIAFTNLLLTIVTLGIYRFWATARERRYLWSRTRFIDDRLEWTGTGLELFIGFLLVFALLFLPLLLLNFVLQGLVFRDRPGIAAAIVVIVYVLIFYLVGVARFRALRYRLSRTYWHGIRGGADDPGFAYGWSYLWKTFVGYLAIGLMVPWSMTSLWNERWRHMSYGPHRFVSEAQWGNIFLRYLIFYLSPIVLFVLFLVFVFIGGLAFGMSGGFDPSTPPNEGVVFAFIVAAAIFYLVFFVVMGVIAMIYYSAFYREAVGALSLSDLDFAFTARTMDWIKLFVGNVALVIFTLGIGIIFLRYRNWKFFIDHLEATGEINLDQLTQSATREPGQGEGLLDAFDIGAI